jgi:16S rRNA (cytidine1402-2'-O)-methyltransferase
MGAPRSTGTDNGIVILAATPMGDVGDASDRLRTALASAPVIAAEDTRRLRRLCADLGVTPSGRVVSFFEANESGRVPQLIEALQGGEDVLVVTDAGMPSVSDPGYRLVVAAVAAGIAVTVLPGPSAVLAALAVSGLPVDRFCFEGFLPRKGGDRRRALAQLAREPRTTIFFEAPHRLIDTLTDCVGAFGDQRPVAVCRELTKTYEEVQRGTLAQVLAWASDGRLIRGEITIVLGGAPAQVLQAGPLQLAGRVTARERAGQARKDAIAAVALEFGVAKREVFDAVVSAKPVKLAE